jgi:chromosome segregation ATPase
MAPSRDAPEGTMDQTPELKRSLFGYRTRDVESILDARERMFERVTEESRQRTGEADQLRTDLDKARQETKAAREETGAVRTELTTQLEDLRQELEGVRADVARLEDQRREAETRSSGLESELREARREVSGLNERLRVADATEADLRNRLEEATTTAPDTRELGAVLEATQQAIGRIMAGARRTAEEDLARAQLSRDEIQGEVDRVRRWRERIEPVTQDVADDIVVAQAQMSQTAERVGEALRPMSEALTSLSERLEDLARVANPSAASARPERVDLVSHEQQAIDEPDRVGTEVAAPQQAPAGAPWHGDPWPDPGR